MQSKKDQFKDILQYAYEKDGEENITTHKLVEELKVRLQSLIEHYKREME